MTDKIEQLFRERLRLLKLAAYDPYFDQVVINLNEIEILEEYFKDLSDKK